MYKKLSIFILLILTAVGFSKYHNDQVLAANNNIQSDLYYIGSSGLTSTATSVPLVSFTIPQTGREIVTADFGDGTFYGAIEYGDKRYQEIISCTGVTQSSSDATATLTGCTRGLLPFTPYTASSTYQFSHAGGSSFKLLPSETFNAFQEVEDDTSPTLGGFLDAGGFAITDIDYATITTDDTDNQVSLIITQNDTTNNPNVLNVINTGAGSDVYVEKDNEGTTGVFFELYHNSDTAHTADTSKFRFTAKDSATNKESQTQIQSSWNNKTDSSEEAELKFFVNVAGSLVQRLVLDVLSGITIGSGTAAGTLQSNGNYDLVLQTGNSTTGNITITDGPSGDINITPDGSGEVIAAGIRIDSPSIGSNSDTDTSIQFSGSNQISFVSSNSTRMTINSNGVVLNNNDLDVNNNGLIDVGYLDMDTNFVSNVLNAGFSTDDYTLGATTTATTTIMYMGYESAAAKWFQADASEASTTIKMLGLAVAAGNTGETATVALPNSYISDVSWSWTPGEAIYLSETTGTLTQTAPTSTGSYVRILGYAYDTDKMYFNPESGTQNP